MVRRGRGMHEAVVVYADFLELEHEKQTSAVERLLPKSRPERQ